MLLSRFISSLTKGFVRSLLACLLAGAVECLWVEAADAHPHVWVDTVVTAVMKGGRIVALREDWLFDEDFTITVLDEVRKGKGLGADRSSGFTPGEIAKVKQNAFSNLRNYNYFTHVWAAGKPVKVQPDVAEFAARLDGERLRYIFTVTLAQPIDPKAGPTSVGIWDDSYYVDVGPTKTGGALVEGEGAASCKAWVIEDKGHPIYFGAIYPKTAEITCSSDEASK